MKRQLRLVILIIVMLPYNALTATLGFMSEDSIPRIHFTQTTHESYLRPLIETLLTKKKSEFAKSTITLTARKRAHITKEALIKLLRSEGFYAATVEHRMIDDTLHFTINRTQPYRIGHMTLNAPVNTLPSPQELNLAQGSIFRSQTLIDALTRIKQHLEQHHCLWEITVNYDVTVHHPDQTASIIITVANSDQVQFGTYSIDGLTSINTSYLEPIINLPQGSCFKRSYIEKARLNLLKTNLISQIDTQITRQKDHVNIHFTIREKKHKTIKLGGGVNSDEGVIFSTGWEHRNRFGNAEKLQINAKLSEILRKVDSSLTIPTFKQPNQNLVIHGDITEENLDAFDALHLATSVTLKRQLTPHISASLGGALKFSDVEEQRNSETFGLFSIPLALDYDKRDTLLNPKKGWFISGQLTPFIDTFNTQTSFVKASIGGSLYHTTPSLPLKPTFALRTAFGSISGQNTADIPADERFYAGGGGSVRGYPFQKLGPLTSKQPTGGRSFAELSVESRFDISKDWGGAIFIDGGNAYEDTFPNVNDDIYWAYGFGIRYYTDFAPIRLDIALPVERRHGIDNNFQFYVSIGQAF